MFIKFTEFVIWFIGLIGLVLVLRTCKVEAGPLDLGRAASQMGFKAPIEVMAAIDEASKAYGVDPIKMLKVAIIESSLNPRAVNYNTNGTLDIGLFQINEIIANGECQAFNVFNLKGNCSCAAIVLKRHRNSHDPFWIGRYHSLTLDKKLNYYRKVEALK